MQEIAQHQKMHQIAKISQRTYCPWQSGCMKGKFGECLVVLRQLRQKVAREGS